MKRLLPLLAAAFLLPSVTFAQAATWQIIPNDSAVNFTATQNNAPVKGSFKTVEGKILFSADDLKDSKVDIKIDMNSINTSYKELVDTLKMADWLDVAKFPEARFISDKITKVKDNDYLASGTLQIRDKKMPLDVGFTVKEPNKNELKVNGETTIKRTTFGVGQGDWASTDEVKDDVKVSFDLKLSPQK